MSVFFSIKTKEVKTVNEIQARSSNIEFDGLNILEASIREGQLVFIVFGGDKPSWDTGLVGMGLITKRPFAKGYDSEKPKNFKVAVDIKLLLDRPIKREDLVPYRDTYDIIGIAPITKWEPNQAISQIAEPNAAALMRAMLDISPSIESDLDAIVTPELMSRIKGTTTMMIPTKVNYGDKIPDPEPETVLTDDFESIYTLNMEEVLDGFKLSERPMSAFRDFVNSSKHIIMTGPPGTGKTTLAERACVQAVKNHYVSGYLITTAISDWSTFDTIGGYMPDKDGRLVFSEGVFLKSIRENKWLIVDEINRAEVDKAFGHFFTALAGKDVELQFKADVSDTDSKNIAVRQSGTLKSFYDEESATYYIGRNWRILGTMNTYDKNSLFALSYAFMRRFALVPVPAPSLEEFSEIINARLPEHGDISVALMKIISASPKKLGAAIVLDIISYLQSSDFKNMADGLCAMLIPQYEGISLSHIKQLYKDFSAVLSRAEGNVLLDYLCEFFDVERDILEKVKSESAEDEKIDE